MQNSPEYMIELERLHGRKSFGTGTGVAKILKKFLDSTPDITSILDFGCGKDKPLEQLQSDKMQIYSYDPITSPIELPESVDLVYSRDVLEHIEPENLDETLSTLGRIGQKYQHHLIACHPAKKGLKDGRNAHLIIEKPEWWQNKIQAMPDWRIIEDWTTGPKTKHFKNNVTIDIIKYIVILEKVDR